jgi:hypothetical protein
MDADQQVVTITLSQADYGWLIFALGAASALRAENQTWQLALSRLMEKLVNQAEPHWRPEHGVRP